MNAFSTRRPAVVLLCFLAALLVGLLLLAYAGVPSAATSTVGPPDSVSITRSVGSVTVTWSAVTGADGFNVNLSTDGGDTWSRAASDQTGTSVTISSGVVDTSPYIAAVQALFGGNGTSWTRSSSIAAFSAPGAPTGVTAVRSDDTDDEISVSWTAPADNGGVAISGYDVEYSTDGTTSWTRAVSGTTSTSTTMTDIDNTIDYDVRVRAKNDIGNGAWAQSATVTGVGTPSSVTVTRVPGSVTVTWSAVSGASKYHVSLSHDHGGSWWRASSNATGTTLTVSSNIVNIWSYMAAVRAVNSSGPGNWKSTPLLAGLNPPGAPNGVTATRSGTGIAASWSAPASNGGYAVTGYDVNYSTNERKSWTRAASDVTGTSQTIANADNTVDYVIAVRAKSSVGPGAWAHSATVAALAAPASVTAHRASSTSDIHVGWTAVTGATGYDVNYIIGILSHNSADTDVSGTTYTITGATTAVPANVVAAVRARNAHGPGPWTQSAPAVTTHKLTASGVTATTATLKLETYGSNWYYKADKSPHNTCSPGQSGMTAAISGLMVNTQYTYSAYSDSSCTNAKKLATASAFTTLAPTLSSSDVRATGVTLTIGDYSGNWYYKANIAPHTSCSSVQTGSAATLSGLTPGRGYTYSAYEDASCTDPRKLATASAFTTLAPTLASSDITATGATLTISGNAGSWHYKADKAPHTSCSSAQSGNTATLSGLTPNTLYAYSTYGDSGCTDANYQGATTSFTTLGSTAGARVGGGGSSSAPPASTSSFDSIVVTRNQYIEAPGNEDLKHNVSNLAITKGASTLAANFLDSYHATGGLERWGYPTSEVVEIETGSLTQFFQRGVLDFHDVGLGYLIERRLAWDYVGGGLGGSADQGVEPAPETAPADGVQVGAFGHYVADVDGEGNPTGFLAFFNRLGGINAFGIPKTEAREDTGAEGMLMEPGSTAGFTRQYFQAAVFQLSEGGLVQLTLLGDTLRGLLVPGFADEAAFAAAAALSIGDAITPDVIP